MHEFWGDTTQPGTLRSGIPSWGGDVAPLLGRTDHLSSMMSLAPREKGDSLRGGIRVPQATWGRPGGSPTQHATTFNLPGFSFNGGEKLDR